jgi:hypothetical protein
VLFRNRLTTLILRRAPSGWEAFEPGVGSVRARHCGIEQRPVEGPDVDDDREFFGERPVADRGADTERDRLVEGGKDKDFLLSLDQSDVFGNGHVVPLSTSPHALTDGCRWVKELVDTS